MKEKDKGSGNRCSMNVGEEMVLLEWDAGGSLFEAETDRSNDSQSLV